MRFTRRPIAAVILLAMIGLTLLALSRAGTSLVVEDALQYAPAAAVFGGKTPFRAMEAASLYKAGWIGQVWLTEGARSDSEVAFEKLGIQPTPEHAYNRQVLEHLGVPPGAIRVLTGRNNNTADEVRTVARALADAHADRVILITSSYHTRRVRTLWRAIVGSAPEAIVRSTHGESFDAARWWRDAADAWTVSREWFGLLNASAGFPVTSEHW